MALRPQQPISTGWTTREWTAWLVDQRVIHSVTAVEPGTCGLCSAPTPVGSLGSPYDYCRSCRDFRAVLRRIVPISFSTSPFGLTSLIAQAKNETDRAWLRWPLASFLHQFLERHWACLVRVAGGPIDHVIPIPSFAGTRGGIDHLVQLHQAVAPWRPPWTVGALTKTRPSQAKERRGLVEPGLFVVEPWTDVRGQRILLVDDLCTSAGTTANAAHALVTAGAETTVAVTIGRQVANSDAGRPLLDRLPGRGWDPDTCAVHPSGSPLATPNRPW